jgi:hypothetical protein
MLKFIIFMVILLVLLTKYYSAFEKLLFTLNNYSLVFVCIFFMGGIVSKYYKGHKNKFVNKIYNNKYIKAKN